MCAACYYKIRTNEKQSKLPKKKCECSSECQEMIPIKTMKGKPMRYKPDHHPKGLDGYNWKGGIIEVGGYLKTKCPNHPFKDCRGYVFVHRLMYEQYYNVCLLPWIRIHHKNKDIKDNRIENLQSITKSDHSKIHHIIIDKSDRFCSNPNCNDPTKIFYDKNGYERWSKDGKGGWLCHTCKERLRYEMKRLKIKNI